MNVVVRQRFSNSCRIKIHLKIYHVVYVIVRTNFPIETFIQFRHDQVSIIFILH